MAWMACHLFVSRSDDAPSTDLVELVCHLLEQPEHRTDLAQLSSPPGPILVSQPFQGWSVITGAAAWIDDLVWAARHLSELGGTRVVSSEIFGNCYRARLSENHAGQQLKLICTPSSEPEELDPMPLYEDAEAKAYDALVAMGIPGPLIAVGTSPLGVEQTDMLSLGQGHAIDPSDDSIQIEQTTAALLAPRFAGNDAPLLPSSVSRDFGLMLFDDRYVEGKPSDAAVDRLLDIEENLLERARRIVPDDRVTLTVTYYAGTFQNELDDMLRARDHHTLPSNQRQRPSWWQFWRCFGRVR